MLRGSVSEGTVGGILVTNSREGTVVVTIER